MNVFYRTVIRAFDLIGAVALSFMLAVVSGQVIARAVFDLTGGRVNILLSGAIELASYSLLLVVFASFPRAMHSGLVNVDLFTARFPGWLNRLLDQCWALLTAVIALGMSWKALGEMQSAFERNLLSQDLDMPLAPFFAYVAVATLAFALIALSQVFTRSDRAHED